MAILSVEDFGAKGNGSDDTGAIQEALLSAKVGDSVAFVPGGVYAVRNLLLPTPTSNGFLRTGLVCIGGMATIKAIQGPSDRYMIATERWAKNSMYADRPWTVSNLLFDGSGIVDYPFISKGWASIYEKCVFIGGRRSSFLFTRRNMDGSNGTTAYLSGCIWDRCRLDGGFETEGQVGSDLDGPTDGSLLGCDITNGLLALANCSGWTVSNSRTYGPGGGASFDGLSRGFVCANNNFDGTEGVSLRRFTFYNMAGIGPGNAYYVPLRVYFDNDSRPQVCIVRGETFAGNQNASVLAYISHENNSSLKTIRSEGNYFKTPDPYRLGAGNTLGLYDIRD